MTEQELNDARNLRQEIRRLEWRIKGLKLSVENIVPIIDGMPHSREAKSGVEKIAVEIMAKEEELEKVREQFATTAMSLTSKIDTATKLSQQEKTVLLLRYVACMNFQEIWLALGTTDARVFYLHRSATKKFLEN